MGTNKRFYEAKARTWGLGESGTGSEQVAIEFEILTPDAPEKALTWYGYFSEKAFDRTIESLRICGWAGANLEEIADGQGGLDANLVSLTVEDEEYDGRTFAKVQWVNRPGGLALKAPLVGERAKSFAAQMQGRIRALDASQGKRPAPAAAPAGNGGAKKPEFDDVPF